MITYIMYPTDLVPDISLQGFGAGPPSPVAFF